MQRIIISLLIGLLAGMVTCRSFQSKPSAVVPGILPHQPVSLLEKQQQKVVHAYQQEKEKLGKKIDTLQRAYQLIVKKMTTVRKENKRLIEQVNHTVSLLHGQPDTLTYLQYCDSLQHQALQLGAGQQEQDSLVQEQVNNLQQQLIIKDQHITAAVSKMESTASLLRQSLAQNGMLEADIKQAKKKSRQHRLFSTLKTIGICAVVYLLAGKP